MIDIMSAKVLKQQHLCFMKKMDAIFRKIDGRYLLSVPEPTMSTHLPANMYSAV